MRISLTFKEQKQAKTFTKELNAHLDGTEAAVKKMRDGLSMTEESYAAEHQQCLKALESGAFKHCCVQELDSLKTASLIAESALQTVLDLLIPLRGASLTCDHIWAFQLQAYSRSSDT